MTLATIVVTYVIGGIVSYGLMYAFWQENWPTIKNWPGEESGDKLISAVFAAFWPLALPIHFISVAVSEKMWPFRHGIKFRK